MKIFLSMRLQSNVYSSTKFLTRSLSIESKYHFMSDYPQIFFFNFLLLFDSNLVYHSLAMLTGYPQSNVNRLCSKMIPFLETFGKRFIDPDSFEERETARKKFKHEVAPYLQHVTLIIDATVITIKKLITEHYSGPNGVWCAKYKCSGNQFSF
jgi:hypothetical protein